MLFPSWKVVYRPKDLKKVKIHIIVKWFIVSVQCSARWQLQGNNSYTLSPISHQFSTPSINPRSWSRHKGSAFFHAQNDAFVQGILGFLKFRGDFLLTASLSALVGFYETRAVSTYCCTRLKFDTTIKVFYIVFWAFM